MITHIGFIMDGNRRFANERNLDVKEGYKAGMLKFYDVVNWAVEKKIKFTTFFALSLDNAHKRSKEELQSIKAVVTKLLEDPKFEKYCIENKIKLNVKGRYFLDNVVNEELLELDKKSFKESGKVTFLDFLEMRENEEELIRDVQRRMNEINTSHDEPDFVVNIALFYDGQDEVSRATRSICQKVVEGDLKIDEITPKMVLDHSDFSDCDAPQIIVRTGKAPRLSGFMLYLSAYAELYLTESYWPELDHDKLDGILDWFNGIKRNFGK